MIDLGKPENKIERQLCEGVRQLKGRAYKLISPGCTGMPDRLVCLPGGRVIFVELKSQKGVLSKIQRHRIAELEELGQNIRVLSSLENVADFLDEYGRDHSGDI